MSSLVEIYPREGTETNQMLIFSPLAIVEIYPREGAETCGNHQPARYKQLKFIPVRGRKRDCPETARYTLWLKFIPVRGRKLPVCCQQSHSELLKFIPVRGRKLHAVHGKTMADG